MILVNFSNQIAAGPKNIAKNFYLKSTMDREQFVFLLPDLPEFRELPDSNNCKKIFVSKKFGILGAIFNAFKVNSILIPALLKDHAFTAILAFGNFLTVKSTCTKVVLLHHPYIVDDELFNKLSIVTRLIEALKRRTFRKTVANVDKIVVQSKYMEKLCLQKYSHSKGKISVIPNPISETFAHLINHSPENTAAVSGTFNILYVSRYYPHKNHQFLADVSRECHRRDLKINFQVTIDENLPGAKSFLDAAKSEGLPITNIGELRQDKLIEYYKAANVFFFPSKSETFGNPIIEAMLFGKALLLPELEYAKAVAGDAALFYENESVIQCADKINQLIDDSQLLESLQNRSLEYSKSSLDVDSWFSAYFSLIKEAE